MNNNYYLIKLELLLEINKIKKKRFAISIISSNKDI